MTDVNENKFPPTLAAVRLVQENPYIKTVQVDEIVDFFPENEKDFDDEKFYQLKKRSNSKPVLVQIHALKGRYIFSL